MSTLSLRPFVGDKCFQSHKSRCRSVTWIENVAGAGLLAIAAMTAPSHFDLSCYEHLMLKVREKRRALEVERALARLAAMEAAIVGLGDEDLLDVADIFSAGDPTPLREIAESEMRRRNISL